MENIEKIKSALDEGGVELLLLNVPLAQVYAAKSQPDAVGALLQLVSRDPSISSSMLYFANTANRASLHPVTDLRTAIVRLGVMKSINIYLTLLMKQLSTSDQPIAAHSRKILSTSVAAAVIYEFICKGSGNSSHYLTGLFSRLGNLAAISYFLNSPPSSELSLDVAEHSLDLNSALLPSVCQKFNLPSDISEPLLAWSDGVNALLDKAVTISNILVNHTPNSDYSGSELQEFADLLSDSPLYVAVA